jgi:hypothetical protein
MVLDDLYRQGLDVPDHVRVLRGTTTVEGVQFHNPAVRAILAGES